MKPWLLSLLAAAVLVGGCGDDEEQAVDAPVVDARVSVDATAADATQPPDAPPLVPSCTPSASENLALEVVAEDLLNPVYVTSPPNDPRLFIIEQPGRIRIIKDGVLLDTPFLEIGSLVRADGKEQGLLGLAFHPDFAQNGRFFIDYTTEETNGGTRIAEYAVSADNPDVADTTEKKLIDVPQPATNHNGGMLAFGPKGYLFISLGDGGGGNNQYCTAQNTGDLLGGLLRIDVDSASPYGIPADNPFADGDGGEPEIWDIGLRNPWRFTFDRETGDMYIGDVGQGSWEEVDFEPANSPGGVNYGWNAMEGTHCFAGGCDEDKPACNDPSLTLPIHEYDQRDSDLCSMTGGYVYRGSCLTAFVGAYFFADYCLGNVWTLRVKDGAATEVTERTADFDIGLGGLASFGEDATGELYIVRREAGTVYRIVAEE